MHRCIKIIVFFALFFSFGRAQALPFDATCSFRLSKHQNLDTIVELTTQGDSNLEVRVRTLYLYIMQNRPALLPTDVEEIFNFIFTQENHTDFITEPSNVWQMIQVMVGHKPNSPTENLRRRDLSMESQILIWLMDEHLTDFTSVINAIQLGNVHRFILKDIERLQPDRGRTYYTEAFNRVLSND